jgi:hypothetical protein
MPLSLDGYADGTEGGLGIAEFLGIVDTWNSS